MKSAGQPSRHTNIRYFSIELESCPTGEMVADFCPNHKQGKMFTFFRDVIMGVIHHSKIGELMQASSPKSYKEALLRPSTVQEQERVGNNVPVTVMSRSENKKKYREAQREMFVQRDTCVSRSTGDVGLNNQKSSRQNDF